MEYIIEKYRRWWRQCVIGFMITGTIYLLTKDIPYSPSSRLFQSYTNKLKRVEYLHTERVRTAKNYFQGYKKTWGPETNFTDSDIAVVIVTVGRDRHDSDYVIQTAAFTDIAIRMDTLFRKKIMFICNVDEHPESHIEALNLAKYIPYIQKKDSKNNMGINSSVDTVKVRHSDKIDKRRMKETEDYVYCLNASLMFKPKFVLVLEDDVVPFEEMFSVLHHVMQDRLHVLNDDKQSAKHFTYLRLFYLLYDQDFISLNGVGDALKVGCAECLVGLYELGAIVCVFTPLLYILAIGWKTAISCVNLDRRVLRNCCLVVLVVALFTSRNGILEARRVSPQLYYLGHGRVSSTPAVLYPSHIIPDLVKHLQRNTDRHKDLEIYKFSVKTGRKGYQLEPNIFNHIGIWSSLRGQRSIEEFI